MVGAEADAFRPCVQGSCLLDVYQRFEEAVEKYQPFWTVLDRLDALLWVVEPENPSRRDTRRRIVVSELLMMSLLSCRQ